MSDFKDSIYAVWVDPTQFDPIKHGPPFLPSGKGASMKLASNAKAQVRTWVKEADLGVEMIPTLKGMAAEVTSGPLGYLSALLVYLRAASMIHQTAHWQTHGQAFYGDHKLFMRIYEDSQDLIDGLAERTVGLGDGRLVEAWTQAKHLERCIGNCYAGRKIDEGPNGLVEISLHIEYHVVEGIRITRQVLEQAGVLTDGTDNLLQGIADKHEEFIYLLKQRSQVTPYSYAR
jgi:DNA-binding ferritin-like protein